MSKLLSFIAAMVLAVLIVQPVSAATIAEQNQPSYWGENCYKIEMSGDIKTYTVTDQDATRVIVKGGTAFKVYESGDFSNLTAAINPKNNKTYGISHVIICAEQSADDPVDENPTDNQEPEDNGGIGGGNDTGQVLDETTQPTPQTLPATGASAVLTTLFGLSTAGFSLTAWLQSAKRVRTR